MQRRQIRTDAVALGAGIAGVSAALHLQMRGRSVVLLDRRGPGEETSHGNAGLIERSSVIPYGFPHDLRTILLYALNCSADVRSDWCFLPGSLPWAGRPSLIRRRIPWSASLGSSPRPQGEARSRKRRRCLAHGPLGRQ